MTESSYRVCAVFTLKDQESKNRFIEFANGDNGLSVTRAAKGCKSLNMFESREDAMKLIIWQEWDCKENQQAYIKHHLSLYLLLQLMPSSHRLQLQLIDKLPN